MDTIHSKSQYGPTQLIIIRWAFQVSVILFLVIGLCFRVAGFLIIKHLEELERRIVLENLSPEEIRNLFVREYLGPTLQEWIFEVEKNLEQHISELELHTEEAEKRLMELASVDRTMKYEITGRRDELCKSLINEHERYIRFSEELIKKMEHLISQNAFHAAPQLARQLIESWKQQNKIIRNRFKGICIRCREATQGISCTSKERFAEPAHRANGTRFTDGVNFLRKLTHFFHEN
jgi:hypothetical protein